MKRNVKVKCPRCDKKIYVMVTDDPGGREIGPPSQDVEFIHDCDLGNHDWTEREEKLFDIRLDSAMVKYDMENPEP